MNFITLTYDSTHFYLVSIVGGWLMVDTGWAGTLPKLLNAVRQKDIGIKEIRYLVVTHFHPDHCGLVEDLKDFGATLIVHQRQVPFVAEAKRFFKPEQRFRPILPAGNLVVSTAESRTLLAKEGIIGELVPTPGHSADSVSLIIDGCCAFTGDLPPAGITSPQAVPVVEESWRRIGGHKVKRVYPAHGTAHDHA